MIRRSQFGAIKRERNGGSRVHIEDDGGANSLSPDEIQARCEALKRAKRDEQASIQKVEKTATGTQGGVNSVLEEKPLLEEFEKLNDPSTLWSFRQKNSINMNVPVLQYIKDLCLSADKLGIKLSQKMFNKILENSPKELMEDFDRCIKLAVEIVNEEESNIVVVTEENAKKFLSDEGCEGAPEDEGDVKVALTIMSVSNGFGSRNLRLTQELFNKTYNIILNQKNPKPEYNNLHASIWCGGHDNSDEIFKILKSQL